MEKRNNIPSKPRDSLVTRLAYKTLLAIGTVSLPIDPFEIIKNFGWKAYSVEEAEEYGVKCPFNLHENKPAINYRVPITGERFIIYYDEKYIPRLRWSIAHEIGHIVLGHKNEFPHRLTETEYSVAEIEAHLFAAELLSPTRIIASDFFPKTSNKISTLCNISLEATNKKNEILTGIRKISAMAIMSREGEELYRNLYSYLLNLSNYWDNRIKERDIKLTNQYEDFIFCDYWDYVKSKMRRGQKELFSLIDDSVAFYDNKDMILFVRNTEAIHINATQKFTITDYLTTFANSSIKNIISIQIIT